MDYRKAIFLAVILFWLSLTGLEAQVALSTSGGNAFGIGGSVSYSIGQMVYTTNKSERGSLSSGVQQAYEISIETELKKAKGITLQCTISPNPTTDFVMLRVEDFQMGKLTYQLYDMNGKLLESKFVESIQTSILMNQRPSATYFLKVTQKEVIVKAFRIIKK